MRLMSEGFEAGGRIPRRFTCEGEDLSPPLTWQEVPDGCQSLALLVEDPDAPDPRAPRTVWSHWVVYNLPPAARSLPEGVSAQDLPLGARLGMNDSHRRGWGGPCPPIGRHRYVFKLFALDTSLPDLGAGSKRDLERAMTGHVLEKAELVGTYEKGD